jgi:thiosulfate/3-mercaptopyruvate sulfurtransferase
VTHRARTPLRAIPVAVLVTITLFVVPALAATGDSSGRAGAGADSLRSTLALTNPPAAGQLIQPEDLARSLAGAPAQRPILLHVGFKFLFKSGHIPGSRFVGPASKPEGLVTLKLALVKVPREKRVVLYCGCCPWADCPNVHPAFRAAREMGFKDVRVLFIAKDLQRDWVDKGLPVSKGDSDSAPR